MIIICWLRFYQAAYRYLRILIGLSYQYEYMPLCPKWQRNLLNILQIKFTGDQCQLESIEKKIGTVTWILTKSIYHSWQYVLSHTKNRGCRSIPAAVLFFSADLLLNFYPKAAICRKPCHETSENSMRSSAHFFAISPKIRHFCQIYRFPLDLLPFPRV